MKQCTNAYTIVAIKNNIRAFTHKMHLSFDGFLTEFSPPQTKTNNSIIVRLVSPKQKLFHFNKLIGQKIKLSIIVFSIDFSIILLQ